MTIGMPYKDGNALWAAVTTRAKAEAGISGREPGAVTRRFVIDGFLARVFAVPGSGWVLKGGNAVLTRVHDARATKDIDLLAELADLDAAVARLREAIDIDLGDHFCFVITGARAVSGGPSQPEVDGCQRLRRRGLPDARRRGARRRRLCMEPLTESASGRLSCGPCSSRSSIVATT